jgi:hypothetical protein
MRDFLASNKVMELGRVNETTRPQSYDDLGPPMFWDLNVTCRGGYEMSGTRRYHFLDAKAQVRGLTPYEIWLLFRLDIPCPCYYL